MTSPLKMRLYDRFCSWISPRSVAEIREYNAALDTHLEYLRYLELENREIQARVALVEEENQRERDRALGYRLVARVEFELRSVPKREKEYQSIKILMNLEQSGEGARQKTISIVGNKQNMSQALRTREFDLPEIEEFLSSRDSVVLFVEPWLRGDLESGDLANMIPDGVFKGNIKFPGGKIPRFSKKGSVQ